MPRPISIVGTKEFKCGPLFRKGFLALVFLAPAVIFSGNRAHAGISTIDVSELCDQAAQHASRETGVPLRVLKTISRIETGRRRASKLQPWPWTVNMEGEGKWFSSQEAARAYVSEHLEAGTKSFDVGCFQINHRWHGHSFQSIDEMFDPLENAKYAARFLRGLYAEFGSWTAAAGAYHSRTPKYSERYTERFRVVWASLSEVAEAIENHRRETPMVGALDAGDRDLAGVLPGLNGGGSKSLGSLVPILRTEGGHARILIALE